MIDTSPQPAGVVTPDKLPGDEQIAAVRLDQYLNALGEWIVIPGQAKYVSIFNVGGSVVNARAAAV